MTRINEFNIEPGTYEHHKGVLYVVIEIVNYMEGPDGKMQRLTDPLVCFREVKQIPGHEANGKPNANPHRVFALTISEFTKDIDGKPRFKMI